MGDPQLLDLNSTMQEIHNMLLRLIGEDIELLFVPGKRPNNYFSAFKRELRRDLYREAVFS